MSLGNRYTVDEEAWEIFHSPPRRQRGRLLGFCRHIAAHPFVRGDYQEAGARGETLEVALFENDFLITWHVGHAVKQVHIIRLDVV